MRFFFSGHETFAAKNYWLKKGLDFVKQGKKFSSDNAVVDLGVGKNMVTSIRFWLKAFGLLDDQDQPNDFAEFIFGENGADVYLEDTLTLWLLHYQLIKQKRASIYSLVFDHFRREKHDFTKPQLFNFLQRKVNELNGGKFSQSTLDSDIRTFLNSYITSNPKDIEEGYSNILQELNLLSHYTQLDDHGNKIDWYRFDVSPKMDLPIEAMLYIIKDHENYGNSISLAALANDDASLGSVFLLTEMALGEKLKEISDQYGVFTETAGNPVLQLKDGLDKEEILRNYYGVN